MMKTHRRMVSKRKRQAQLKRLSLCFAAVLMVIGLSVSFGTRLVSANDHTTADTQNEYKYYKSIELEYGDTLWGIAKEYMNEDYDSIYDYIDELKAINGLESDDIHAGRYLTVVYYDSEFK